MPWEHNWIYTKLKRLPIKHQTTNPNGPTIENLSKLCALILKHLHARPKELLVFSLSFKDLCFSNKAYTFKSIRCAPCNSGCRLAPRCNLLNACGRNIIYIYSWHAHSWKANSGKKQPNLKKALLLRPPQAGILGKSSAMS